MKIINSAIEELVKEKNESLKKIEEAVEKLKDHNFNSIEPALTDDLKTIFENICKFMKMDNAAVSLREVDKVDYTDLISQASE